MGKIVSRLEAVAGEGFDFDGDGEVDNALGANRMFTTNFNPTVAESIAMGTFLMALELDDRPADGECLTVNVWQVSDSDDNPRDNFGGEETFWVNLDSNGPDGYPHASFPGASRANGELAGGPTDVTLLLPLGPLQLPLPLMQARIDGVFFRDGSIQQGHIGGLIPHERLFAQLREAGIDPPAGIRFEDILGEPDMDIDGDEVPDAYSLGLNFDAQAATLITEFPADVDS